jgi:hypothetical protein
MCFSAEADFVSASVIGVVGVATLSHVDEPRQLPLAALPLTFAVHQATQGLVWMGLEGHLDPPTYRFALQAYLLVAWALLPLLAPLAIFLVEPDRARRRALGVLVGVGLVVGVALLPPVVTGSVSAEIAGSTLRYRGAGDHAGVITALYVIAACGAFLLSSSRRVRIFGVANVAAVALLAWIESTALTSVWCTWAAIASVIIYLEIKEGRRNRHDHLVEAIAEA